MKNASTDKINRSAFVHALTSAFIIAANSPSTQQAIGLLALMLFTLRGQML